jgi:hypothetical protein
MTRLVTLVVLALVAFAHTDVRPATAGEVTARSIKAGEAPEIDGKVDKIWDRVRATRIPIAEGTMGKVDVTMRVLYTEEDIFFLVQWPDKTMSMNRFWEFDGKEWKRDPGGDDQFAIVWNVGNSVAGFERRGCAELCHSKDRQLFLATSAPAERAQLWTWKAQRTNPVGQAEVQRLVPEVEEVDGVRTGRRRDGAGGYQANWDPQANRPRFTFKDGVKPGPVLRQAEAVAVKDAGAFKRGARVPRDVVAPFTDGRAVVQAAAVWERNRWTLELRRARKTDDADKAVQFAGEGPYHFGIAVHDNESADDHSHTGRTAYRLLLK